MERVEMMDALNGFNDALGAGTIEVQPTGTDPKVFQHADVPDGKTVRMSFVTMNENRATAIAVVVHEKARIREGYPVFHIGCAVSEDQRGKGLGQHVLKVALEDIHTNMVKRRIPEYWIESLVEVDNLASVAMTTKILGVEPKEVIDQASGEPSLKFLKRVSAA